MQVTLQYLLLDRRAMMHIPIKDARGLERALD
jgi:hypothetical protein